MAQNISSSSAAELSEDGIFGFKPNVPLEQASLVLFSILTFVLLVINIRKRTWYMMAIVVVK